MKISQPHTKSGPSYGGRRIGLLGGSFNPAHAGHRAISLYALKQLGLDEIWWLVSPQNPLKPVKGMARLEARLASAETAARHPRIKPTTIEAELGTTYTIDTIRALRARFPRARFVWLMGADNMQQIRHWKRWPEIFTSVRVAVFRRPNYAAGRKCGKAAQRFDRDWIPANRAKILARQKPPVWLVLNNPLNPMSATKIRKDQSTWPQ